MGSIRRGPSAQVAHLCACQPWGTWDPDCSRSVYPVSCKLEAQCLTGMPSGSLLICYEMSAQALPI